MRKPKTRRTRPNPKRQILKLFSQTVRERANGKCEICGSTRFCQAHHILEKRHYPKYISDPSNGICLCAKHHSKYGALSAHTNPVWFSECLQLVAPERYNIAKSRVLEYGGKISPDRLG